MGEDAEGSFAEAGAIYEGKNDPDGAIQQYLQGALAGESPPEAAAPTVPQRQRLTRAKALGHAADLALMSQIRG